MCSRPRRRPEPAARRASAHPVTPSGGRNQVLLWGGARGCAATVAAAATRFVARVVKTGRTMPIASSATAAASASGFGAGPRLSRDSVGAETSCSRGALGSTALKLASDACAEPDPSGTAEPATDDGTPAASVATTPSIATARRNAARVSQQGLCQAPSTDRPIRTGWTILPCRRSMPADKGNYAYVVDPKARRPPVRAGASPLVAKIVAPATKVPDRRWRRRSRPGAASLRHALSVASTRSGVNGMWRSRLPVSL
jgi:hypothetical protein